jgi:hypothetical protein
VRTYDNSYIVVDLKEDFILEAVGHNWSVRKVEKLARILNICTLGESTDRLLGSVERLVVGTGLNELNSSERFSFSSTFADIANSQSAITRQRRKETLLRNKQAKLKSRP